MSIRDLTKQRLHDSDLSTDAAPRFWVVPHTHWDREWYLPFEQLRVRLARALDEVLDTLERERNLSFTLDGQAILLEDYLEVRPENEHRLRSLLASGRLAAGPSYVLPDEFLVGQEALVRNLLLGRQTCSRFGAAAMPVAYAPDTFGHVAQLPQILRGFGIDAFVFWRGLGDEAEQLGAVFQWQGHDGSEVLAVRLLGGYAALKCLGRWTRGGGPEDDPSRWPDTAAIQIREHMERFRGQFERSGIRDILVCNGDDHEPMQPDIQDMLTACQQLIPGSRFQVATFADYVDALRWRIGEPQLHSGELVGGYEACVVRGVNSTRMYLKQANEATERAILTAEALAAIAHLQVGASYPIGELRLAWRELLKNHPHDSLPGCSLDEVHRDMEQRFRGARQTAEEVGRAALQSLSGKPRPMRPWLEDLSERSIVNTLPFERTGIVELELPDELRHFRDLVVETRDEALPLQLQSKERGGHALMAIRVPGLSSRGLRVAQGKAPLPENGARAPRSGAIENDYYRIEAAPNGTLTVTDQLSGHTWEGLHWFQDEADRGDEYSFCPVTGSAPWDSRQQTARVRVISAGPWVAELEISLPARLPRGLLSGRRARSSASVSCPIRSIVRLTAGVDRIEFRTTVENRATEHRLRVLFAAPESSQSVRAESAFAMLSRPARPIWNGRWREPPADTHHTAGVVAAGRLALMGKGLPEYEAIPREDGGVDLALTLLRCVGFLSWGDLETRVGAQEPHIPTPDAQCQGKHVFQYAISLRGETSGADLIRASQDYRTGFALGPRGPEFEANLRIDGDGCAFSTLKGAEGGHGLIVRLYNPGAKAATVHLSGRDILVQRCQLDETDKQPLKDRDVQLHPGEIATFRITKA